MDIRPLPGMTLNDLNGLLGEALAPVSERWPGRLTFSELHPPIPGYECPPDHKLVQVVEKLLGAQTDVVNYCTEAPFIQTLCPTLVLGPGSINQAHQPDEFLETRFIKPTRELISRWSTTSAGTKIALFFRPVLPGRNGDDRHISISDAYPAPPELNFANYGYLLVC